MAKERVMREAEEELESSYPNWMGEEEEVGIKDSTSSHYGVRELRESEPGKIKQITLKNFMCHRRLTVSREKSCSFGRVMRLYRFFRCIAVT